MDPLTALLGASFMLFVFGFIACVLWTFCRLVNGACATIRFHSEVATEYRRSEEIEATARDLGWSYAPVLTYSMLQSISPLQRVPNRPVRAAPVVSMQATEDLSLVFEFTDATNRRWVARCVHVMGVDHGSRLVHLPSSDATVWHGLLEWAVCCTPGALYAKDVEERLTEAAGMAERLLSNRIALEQREALLRREDSVHASALSVQLPRLMSEQHSSFH